MDLEEDLEEIKEFLESGKRGYEDLEEELGKSRSTVYKKLEALKEFVNVEEEVIDRGKKLFYISDEPDRTSSRFVVEPKTEYVIGATGDWHIGNSATDYDALKRYLEDLHEAGVDYVLHTGDLLDGFKVYRGHIQELFAGEVDGEIYNCSGVDEQKRLFRDVFAQDFVFKTVSGNHEYKSMRKDGHQPLESLDVSVDGFDYLEEFNAELDFNGVEVELIHPRLGKAYSKSYRSQQLIRERSPDNFPDLFLVGHTHDSGYFLNQGVHSFMTGTFMGENNLSKRSGYDTVPNGYLLRFGVVDGEVRDLRVRHLRYD